MEREFLPRAGTALLLIDLINPLDFAGGADIAPPALAAARRVARLKRALGDRGIPAIYVNDNFGHWRSDFRTLVSTCRARGGASAALVRLLTPARDDLTVLKPRHSAFHATPLAMLLAQMGTRRLVIAGLATDLCVQLSAADAYLHGHALWVPSDCSAAETPERHAQAMDWMGRALKCRTDPAVSLDRRAGGPAACRLPFGGRVQPT